MEKQHYYWKRVMSETEVRNHWKELGKAKKVLDGVRGKAPVNKNAVLNILLKTSQLLQDCPQIKELDINPLFAGDKDARAADARIILE